MRWKITKQTSGYLLAAVAGCSWSTLGVLGKLAYSFGADPLTVISLRATIATVIVAFFLLITNPRRFRIKPVDFPFFFVYGFLGVAMNYLGYFYALRFTTVAPAITLLYTYPAMVVVLAFIMYREPITKPKVIALTLTFLGIALSAFGLSSPKVGLNLPGLLFGLLAALGNAAYTLSGKRAQVSYNPQTSLFYSFLFGALTLLTFRYAELGAKFVLEPRAFLVIFIIALVPTLLGYGLYTYSLRFIEAGRSSITSSIEPAIAIYLAFIVLGEVPSSVQIFASGLIILGVVVLHLRK